MKKLLLILFALILVLVTAACGNKDEVSESDSEIITEDTAINSVSDTLDTEVSTDIADGAEDTTEDTADSETTEKETLAEESFMDNVASLDDEQKKELIDEAAREGIDVKFDDDGSATFTYGDGYEGQLGGEWPKNDHTKLIPEPEIGTLISAATEENTFMAMYGEVTIYDAVTYSDLVREKGFDVNLYSDDSLFDEGIFSFYAENQNGSFVTVDYMDDALVISVTIE